MLTLPYPLRYRCAYDARLTSEVLRAFLRALFAELRRRARQHWELRAPQCGAVTFIQRFGSALNLNLHFHTLALEAALALTPVAALAQHQFPEGSPPGFQDLDRDSMDDNTEDNCSPLSETASNVTRNLPMPGPDRLQRDFDGDGYGTLCDADYDNSGIVGYPDFFLFAQVVGTVDTHRHPRETPTSERDWNEVFWVGDILVTSELMDHTGDGRVNLADLDVLLRGFGGAPGPSAVGTAQ